MSELNLHLLTGDQLQAAIDELISKTAEEVETQGIHSDNPTYTPESLAELIANSRPQKTMPQRAKLDPLSVQLPPAQGKPRCWGYGRVSTGKQFEADNSVPDQKLRIEFYYKVYIEPKGVVWNGFHHDGKGVSARSVPFFQRPCGKQLLKELRHGDHIVFDKLDRVWRDAADFLNVSRWFTMNGITLHIVNLGGHGSIQTGTMLGDFMLTLIAAIAQLESDTVSQRMRDVCRMQRKQAETTNVPPVGCKVGARVPGKKRRKFLWDIDERRRMATIVKLREVGLLTFEEIAWAMDTHLPERKAKMPVPPVPDENGYVDPKAQKEFNEAKKSYLLARLQVYYNLYCREIGYRILGITDPRDIPRYTVMDAVARKRSREFSRKILSIRGKFSNTARRERAAAERAAKAEAMIAQPDSVA